MSELSQRDKKAIKNQVAYLSYALKEIKDTFQLPNDLAVVLAGQMLIAMAMDSPDWDLGDE